AVSELLGAGAKFLPQLALLARHRVIRPVLMHRQRFQRIHCRPLRQIARGDARPLQFIPQVCGEGRHGCYALSWMMTELNTADRMASICGVVARRSESARCRD